MTILRRTTLLLVPLALTALAGCQDHELPTESADVGAIAFNQGQSKSAVCHYDADAGSYALISVANAALPAHVEHGDASPGEAVPNMPGFEFDEACQPVATEELGRIAFHSDRQYAWEFGDGTYNIDTMDADGANVTRIGPPLIDGEVATFSANPSWGGSPAP
ncbi:hypothetical protein BH23GEM7_BH23GEM7_41500 [soil metagenome]